jgi:hypothetical protein
MEGLKVFKFNGVGCLNPNAVAIAIAKTKEDAVTNILNKLQKQRSEHIEHTHQTVMLAKAIRELFKGNAITKFNEPYEFPWQQVWNSFSSMEELIHDLNSFQLSAIFSAIPKVSSPVCYFQGYNGSSGDNFSEINKLFESVKKQLYDCSVEKGSLEIHDIVDFAYFNDCS